MEVPDIMLNVGPVLFTVEGPTSKGHAARTLTPGPVMSGFRMPGLARLGPLDENDVIAGAGDVPRMVPLKMKDTVGFDEALM